MAVLNGWVENTKTVMGFFLLMVVSTLHTDFIIFKSSQNLIQNYWFAIHVIIVYAWL